MLMNRLTWHHSGGGYIPSPTDLEHYHYVIDGDGLAHKGKHAVEDNAPGKSLNPGGYAAHTWKLNSANIGVSLASMWQGKWEDPLGGKNPVRNQQVDALIKLSATLVLDYGIQVDRRFTLSHAEVQPTLGVVQKNKWDFDYDPRYVSKTRDPIAIGDELRQELRRALSGLIPAPKESAKSPVILRQGSVGTSVLKLQGILGLKQDGVFGPKTRDAVQAYQRSHEMLPDGIVGPVTWASLLAQTPRVQGV